MDNNEAGYDQGGMSVKGNLYQAARDIVNAVVRPAWDFDTSLLVHGFDIGARIVLAAYAAYRLGYSRGLSAGINSPGRREIDT